DGQFAVAAIDQYGELDRLRPSEIDQRIHGRTDGPPGEEDVVDQQDAAAVDRERNVRALDDRVLHASIEIVAVERDVDDTEGGERPALRPMHLRTDALRQVDAAGADTH